MLCTGTVRVRTRVYVDGFNLYYGAVKRTPFKWLDPVRLTRLLLPDEYTIEKLLYFTARVSGKIDRRAPARQQTYLNALGTLPETEVHFGNFLGKTILRPLTNLPVAGRRITTPQGAVMLPAGPPPSQGTVATRCRSVATGCAARTANGAAARPPRSSTPWWQSPTPWKKRGPTSISRLIFSTTRGKTDSRRPR